MTESRTVTAPVAGRGGRRTTARVLRIAATGWALLVAVSIAAALQPQAITYLWLLAAVLIPAGATLLSWRRPVWHGVWFVAAMAALSALAAASFGLFLLPALAGLMVAQLLES